MNCECVSGNVQSDLSSLCQGNILFTGFEPFGGERLNPSWEAVSRLPDQLAGFNIRKVCLPVEYGRVRTILADSLQAYQPLAVVCVGQAGGQAMMTPEKVAINWMESKSADGAGILYEGEPVLPGGETAYFSTLPVREIVDSLLSDGIPAAVSFSAGTYVCNCTMYHLMDLISSSCLRTIGGFVHVPYQCEQVIAKNPSVPSFTLSQMIRGLTVIAETVIGFLADTGTVPRVPGRMTPSGTKVQG